MGLYWPKGRGSGIATTPSTAPFDRRASWLVHLPARQPTSRRLSFAPAMTSDGKCLEPENGHYEMFNGEPGFFSPGQMKFEELVTRLQQRELELQKGRERTPMGQREAQGKAARFREKYSRRHSSEGISPGSCEDTDFLARDIYGFPYVEESPDGKSLESQSQGGFSFGGESEFWRSARNMYDAVPEQGPDQYLPNSLRNQSTVDKQGDEMQARNIGVSPNEDSPVQSSIGGESEFWRNARHMHATIPDMTDPGEHPVAKEMIGKLQKQEQTGENSAMQKSGKDSIVRQQVQGMTDSGDSSGYSPSVPELSQDKLLPFTDSTDESQPSLDGARVRALGKDSLVRRRVQDMSSPPGSVDQGSPSGGVPKLPHGKLQPFEESRDESMSSLKAARAEQSESMVRRRVHEMNSPSGSVDQNSPSGCVSKLPHGKIEPFEEGTDESRSPLKGGSAQSLDSMVRRRVQEMNRPSGSIDKNSPLRASEAAQKRPHDKLGLCEEIDEHFTQLADGAKSGIGTTTDSEAYAMGGLDELDGGASPSRVSNTAQDLQSEDTALSKEGSDEYGLSPGGAKQGVGGRAPVNDNAADSPGMPKRVPMMTHRADDIGDDSVREPSQMHSAQSNPVSAQERSGRKDEAEVQKTSQKGTLTASAALRIGSKVGGMFNSMFGGNKGADSDELKAVAAFRKTQGERRVSDDDATSASSYRLLPDGIRRVVKNFSTRELAQQQKEIEEGVDVDAGVSPSRSGTSSSTVGESLSPEHGRFIHQRVMENSQLIGDFDAKATIIDTDGTTSDVTYDARMDPKLAASLFLSPEILSKRLHQAIRAIERHNWEQVSYLLSANPWLAEMTDVTTGQYLLHKLALYGAGIAVFDETGSVVHVEAPAAPDDLSLNLIQMFPASVYKFDEDGNLPLHMAAVSGNQEMCRRLGERFPSGASVRNVEGLLPLHMAIQSCSSPAPSADGTIASPSEIVKTILGFFPGAVAVADNDGNLPIHCAAAALHGEIGVDIIYMLLDEADKQVEKNGLMFRCTEVKTLDDDSETVVTDITGAPTESSAVDDSAYCNLVRNDMGHTALMVAIRERSGWEIVEALACGPGGKRGPFARRKHV